MTDSPGRSSPGRLGARRRPAKGTVPRASGGTESIPAHGVADDRFFRHIMRSMRNGVIAVSADGRLAFANGSAYTMLDLPPGDADLGRPYADVFREQPDITRTLNDAFELSHLPNRAEMRLKSTGKVIGYTLSQVKDEDGRVTGAALFFKDLTQVEQIEERERLRDRLAALGEMAAAIAHELKNPLAGIEVMAGLLRRHVNESPDVQSLLNDIISEAKMANAIVQEVLEFVRPIRLQVQHTSLAQVLHDAVRTAESKISRRGVDVTLHVDDAVPLIQADHHQLCQLFTNLLINAFEALNGRGSVAITARTGRAEEEHGGEPREPGRAVFVEVADNGPGIPGDIIDRVFNPFFTTKPQGSGLGLAIVRKIVDAHEGRIDLHSTPGRGTSFRLTLPVARGRAWFERAGV